MSLTTRILAALLVGLACPVFTTAQDPGLSRFEALKQPKISVRKSQKMLVVEAKGDPNVVGGKAFGLLFQLYYSMKETSKGPPLGAARARWPGGLNGPKSEWIGLYALPVPETVTKLPPVNAADDLKVSLTVWEYGEIAEILHVGSYSTEEPTVGHLREFIKQEGYVIVGGNEHEEEYVKGPTMNGRGDPDSYLTIIRYRVRKASNTEYIEITQ